MTKPKNIGSFKLICITKRKHDDQTQFVVGTGELAVTDMDGRFTINAAKGAKVKVSYLGFVDCEVKASENMNIAMSEDTQALSEVVVVGYGTMKRSDMTGALSSVNTKEMAKRTSTNPAEAMAAIGRTCFDRSKLFYPTPQTELNSNSLAK